MVWVVEICKDRVKEVSGRCRSSPYQGSKRAFPAAENQWVQLVLIPGEHPTSSMLARVPARFKLAVSLTHVMYHSRAHEGHLSLFSLTHPKKYYTQIPGIVNGKKKINAMLDELTNMYFYEKLYGIQTAPIVYITFEEKKK